MKYKFVSYTRGGGPGRCYACGHPYGGIIHAEKCGW